jgi:hypothetical protein
MAKSKSALPSLQRGGRLQAVVEHVINGARMVLFIPKENTLILFGIVGASPAPVVSVVVWRRRGSVV